MVKGCIAILFMMSGLLVTACSGARPPPAGGASSSIMVKLTQEELIAQADLIVVGVVTDKKSQWDSEHKSIYTLVTISVEEWIKGSSGTGNVTITVPGGEVGGTTQSVEDMPGFRAGERAVIFLKQRADGASAVVGGWQGKIAIEGGQAVSSNISLQELISQLKAKVNKPSR